MHHRHHDGRRRASVHTFITNAGLALLTVAALMILAPRVAGQSYPLPGAKGAAPVLCVGCPGVNADLPTYPYSPPLSFVGRYVDSQTTPNFQHIGFRTAKARSIRVFPQQAGAAPPRVYIQIGNAVGAYALDTFFSSRLPGGMVSVGTLGRFTGSNVGGNGRSPLEKIAMWDGFMYPEAVASQWYSPMGDVQDPMGKGGAFDQDDRGNLYSVHGSGWGIALDDGRTSGSHFPKVVQMVNCGGSPGAVCPTGTVNSAKYQNTRHDGSQVSGQSILAVRDGGKYYAIVAGRGKDQAVFDVTDATSPRLVTTRAGRDKAIVRYDRSDTFSRVAYVDGRKALHVFSYNGLINGTEIGTYAGKDGGFVDVAIDENGNIWAAESSRVLRLTPAGNGYTESEFTPFGAGFRDMEAISAGAGHLVVMGADYSGGARYDVRLAKIEAAGPRLIDTDNFFKNYYHGGKTGYAEPGQYTKPFDVQIMAWKGKTYVFYSASGLGEVLEIVGAAPPPIVPPIDPPKPPTPVPPPCTCTCKCV